MHVMNSASLAPVGLPPPSPRNLLRRLSGAPPKGQKRRGTPHPGPQAASAIQEDVAASWQPASRHMGKEYQPQRRPVRRKGRSLAGSALRVLLGCLLFVTDALGVSQRARAVWARFMQHAGSVSGRWAQRLAVGRQMTRKLSAVALNTLGRRVSTNKERVAGLLRRAMSAESRLDTVGAISCYQVRPRPGPGCRVTSYSLRHATQAANDLVPEDSEPLVGLAKCISDRGACPTTPSASGAPCPGSGSTLWPEASDPLPAAQCLSLTSSGTGSWHGPWPHRRRGCRSRCV
jgi:hypothetical protein